MVARIARGSTFAEETGELLQRAVLVDNYRVLVVSRHCDLLSLTSMDREA